MKTSKKYKKIAVVMGILIIISVGYIIYQNGSKDMQKICIEDKKCFVIEVADSDEEGALGLSGRQSLDENKGMLFIFEEELIPGFWMKDMNFPLDIIWISSDFEIIGIEKDLSPCVYGEVCSAVYPLQPIKYVLEVNSKLLDKYNISSGDKVFF